MKTTLFFLLLLSAVGLHSQNIGLTPFASGFSNPVEITHAGDSRLFVVEQGGAIKIVNSEGEVNPQNFLTIPSSMLGQENEQGLLGLAFHPNYATNGYFYVNYTRADGDTVIERYTVSDDDDIADAESGETILIVEQPFDNHNGGSLKFGPGGLLFIGMGDGGSGGDPGNRAQDITENLGKMLRIDVDSASPYGIPPTNPYVGIDGNDEIWAVGVRNPWKFSFDRDTNDLWIADVGQGEVEEIDKLVNPIEPGLNLGWDCFEGSQESETANCTEDAELTMPYAEYLHSNTDGCSITGGYVYRGSLYPNFEGVYFFGDYCMSEIGTVDASGTLSFTTNLSFAGNITTFGEDADGELYVQGGNTIYKITDLSLGADDFAANGMRLYPNPSNGELFLNAPSLPFPAQFQLYDQSGRVVVDQKLENTSGSHFITGDLADGVYMVKLEDGKGNIYSTKLAVD